MKSLLERFALFAILAFLALLAIPAYLHFRASARLQNQLERIRASGSPTSLEELYRPIPDAENAYLKLSELADELEALEITMNPVLSSEDDPDVQAKANAAFLAFEQTHPNLIARVRAASRLRHAQAPRNYSGTVTAFSAAQLQSIQLYRSAARALSYDAEVQLANGNTDEAIADAVALLRWSDLVGQESTMVHFLVSVALRSVGNDIALRSIARQDATPKVRDELLAHLANWDAGAIWSTTIDGARAYGLSSFNELPAPTRLMLTMKGDQSSFLDVMENANQVGVSPWGYQLTSIAGGPLTANLMPGIASAISVHRRSQAESQAIQILAAWQDKGSTATTIGALGLSPSVTIDPYDGTEMKIKQTQAGLVIYSVGQNGVDDGGSVQDYLDIGFETP